MLPIDSDCWMKIINVKDDIMKTNIFLIVYPLLFT